MPIKTNKHRPLLEDAMNAYYPGVRWYEFLDSKNKVYANIRLAPKLWDKTSDAYIDNPKSIPTEAQLNAKLKELQDAYDAEYEYEGD